MSRAERVLTHGPETTVGRKDLPRLGLGLLAICILEVGDYLTGPYVSFGLLFLLPVSWLAWHVGAAQAAFAAVFAVTCETLVDLAWPQVTGLGVYLWNALSRGSVLVLGAVAVARIRESRESLAAANARLDGLLATESQAREETERRLGLLADTLADYAIVLLDPRGGALSWSAATPRLTGRSAAAIAGRSLAELFPSLEVGAGDLEGPLLRGERVEIEGWTRRADGEPYCADAIVYTLGTAPRQRLLAIVRDVTRERRTLEALREARDAAVAAVRGLQRFSYTVAHDLRAPLRAIDGFGAMLEEDAADRLDDGARRHVSRMRHAARRMGHLVDDLLKLARVERTPVEYVDVDLTAMAHELAGQLQAGEPDRRVEVSVAEGLRARGDPELVAVLLRNLLENAWKFTARRDEAHIRIDVLKCGVGEDPTFFVQDDGAGFDMRFVDRLFRPFERLHTLDAFEGTGIGLATVRAVVERHGGRAWAEGAVGEGATVYFTLPAQRSAALPPCA